MKFKYRPLHAIVTIPLLLGLLWPWTEEVVPLWSVRLTTRSGQPAVDVPVQQVSIHQTVERQGRTELRRTDHAGEVTFPARYVRMNVARLILGVTSSILRYWHHASFGPYGQILIGIEGPLGACEALIYSPRQGRAATIKSECVVPDGFKASTYDTARASPGR